MKLINYKLNILILISFLFMSSGVFSQEINITTEDIIKNTINQMYPDEKVVQQIKGYQIRAFMYDHQGGLLCFFTTIFKVPDFLETIFHYGTEKGDAIITYDKGSVRYIVNNKESNDESLLNSLKAELSLVVQYEPFRLYKHFKKGNKHMLIGEEKVKGRDCFVIEYNTGKEFKETFFIDKNTYLILKVIKEFEDKNKAKMVTTESFFIDYKEIDGIKIPFLREKIKDKTAKATIEIDDYKFFY